MGRRRKAQVANHYHGVCAVAVYERASRNRPRVCGLLLDQLGGRLMHVTEKPSEEDALKTGNYPVWYGYQISRIRRLAKRDRPEVLATMEWSLPHLTRMANGHEPPVEPPPAPQSAREIRVAGLSLVSGRKVLTL